MTIIRKIALCAAAVCLASCVDDFLEARTESSFTDAAVFSDPTLATGAVMGIYESINYNSFNGRLWPYHGYNNDTERHLASTSGVTPAQNDSHSAYAVYKYAETDNYFGDAFSYAMIAVERANNCIEGLRTYGDTEHDAELAYLLGEALFLRAWIYYELVGLWGNIPARFESLSNENLYLGRADRDVIWKQLLADLREAAERMPWPGEGMTATVLRPNRAAAKALRARIALAAGGYAYHLYGELNTPCLSRDPELTVEKTYTIARDECRDIIRHEGSGFVLEQDFSKIFKDNCAVRVAAGGEALWELPFKYNQRGNWMVAAGVYHRGAGGSGTIAADSDPYTSVYMGGTMGVVPTLYYDFDPQDRRRDISVVPFRWADGVQELTRPTMMTAGKLRAEWKDPARPKFSANANDGITPIVLRYADVLLMFAEADNELNGGPTDEAKQALQRVRERAFGTSQAAYVAAVSASKTDFLGAVQEERRLEFVGEMIRKQDLIRWNLLKTNMDRVKQQMRDLRTLSGAYADVPAYVFWKFRSDDPAEREIVWYGLDRGQTAPGIEGQQIVDPAALEAWMKAGGWKNWNPAGNAKPAPAEPALWITPSADSGYLTDDYIEAQYYADPDRRQDMPLPSSVIMNSQGALDNASLGYTN
ncbi:RagB/SusD family nutrient uptake outer membrane protein [Alistipes sp.]|uniref:RagB/SusD family nutrient uptake outer membrane protein n=1 Tax=Alistipes sp. TaxID=1872444 RepID=UPI003AF0A953